MGAHKLHTDNCTCNSSHLIINVNSIDPTRTTMLRNAFANDMKRRFAWLTKLIQQAIIQQDVFDLKQPQPIVFAVPPKAPLPAGTLPGPKAYQFLRNPEKVSEFMAWLQTQVDKGILNITTIEQIGRPVESAWTNLYIEDSYKRGVIRARYELNKAGFTVPPLSESGGIQATMGTPFHLDRAGLLYTRTFQELKGITAQMDTQISRILAQGIADGDNPRVLANKLVKTITGPMGKLELTDTLGRFIPAKRRATILARTEIIRAHHQAMVQEYRNWGVQGVMVKAEWVTAQDGRVCARCLALEGKIFTLDEIQNKIPLHPQCRCIAIPTMPNTPAFSSKEQRQRRRRN